MADVNKLGLIPRPLTQDSVGVLRGPIEPVSPPTAGAGMSQTDQPRDSPPHSSTGSAKK